MQVGTAEEKVRMIMAEKLDPWALGVATGAVWTIYTAFIGIGSALGWEGLSEWLSLLSKVYIGFSAEPVGILIGCVWAFIDGLIAGALIATVYNLCRKIKD